MNGLRFDAAAGWLTIGSPRRRLLTMLASLGAAGVALPETVLACKKVGKKCDKNKDCCDGAKCKKDKCACKPGRQKCGGKCYHLDRDEKHCGACNIQCVEDEGEICDNGRCVNVPS